MSFLSGKPVPKKLQTSPDFAGHFAPETALQYRQEQNGLVKFEEYLERLEKIVLELEKGKVPLEKSLTLFEEGMQLSATCRKQLEEAEGKVEILLKQNGKLQTEPFEPPTEKALRK
jgi:exodeoxyribonuclease VII small subunit